MIETDIRKECNSRCCGRKTTFRPPRPNRAAGGWSLIELLVATALGMSLVTLALRAFLTGSGLQAEVSAELRLHEGARFALHVIGRSAHFAGFPGCLGESPEFAPGGPDWTGPMQFSAVEGYNEDRPHSEFNLTPGSDAIAFWWSVAGCGTDGPPELQPPPEASVTPGLRGNLFYIARRGGSPDNPPALFMRELADFGDPTPARELVEGVESMRFLFGDPSGSARLSAHQVQDWQNLRDVRIDLQLQSPSMPDMRREFGRTFTLRNRLIGPADFPSTGFAPEEGDS